MKPFIEEGIYFNEYDGKIARQWYVHTFQRKWWEKILRMPGKMRRLRELDFDSYIDKVFLSQLHAQDWIDEYLKFNNISNKNVFYVPMDPQDIARWKLRK